MIPFFEIFSIKIYSFWLLLWLSILLFIYSLKINSSKFWINFSFFSNRIIWFFVSSFFFSRLFFVISKWNDFVWIDSFWKFFITSDYNFSLTWAIFWFMLVLLINTRKHKLKSWKYVDAVVLSFFLASILGYFWAFLWGQIYWIESHSIIALEYTNAYSPVSTTDKILPLAIFYSIISTIIYLVLKIFSLFVKIRWVVWFSGLVLFWAMTIALENYNWKTDFFAHISHLNFSQITSFFLILFSFYRIYILIKTSSINNEFQI